MEPTKGTTVRAGELVDILIWVQGYTQTEIAKKAGLSRSYLNNLCRGADPMTEEAAFKLGRFLGFVPGRLLNLEHRFEGKRGKRGLEVPHRRKDAEPENLGPDGTDAAPSAPGV